MCVVRGRVPNEDVLTRGAGARVMARRKGFDDGQGAAYAGKKRNKGESVRVRRNNKQ